MDCAAWGVGEEEEFMWNVARENPLPAQHEGFPGQNNLVGELNIPLHAQGKTLINSASPTCNKKTRRNRSVSELTFALNAQRDILSELLDERMSKQEALLQRVVETIINKSPKAAHMQSHDLPDFPMIEDEKSLHTTCGSKGSASRAPSAVVAQISMGPLRQPRVQGTNSRNRSTVHIDEQLQRLDSDGNGKFWRLVHGGAAFDSFFGAMIVCNCIFLGYRIEYVSSTLNDDETTFSSIVSTIFTLVFTVELILRLLADGCRYFHRSHPSFLWNIFDSVLVSVSLMGLVVKLLEVMSNNKSADFSDVVTHGRMMRILRLVRILKIVRMVRIVRFVYSLRIFVLSIVGTITSLCWALLLLFLLFFSFGAAFTARVSDYLIEAKNSDKSVEYVHELKEFWGSLPRSVLTLYMCISGGIDWRDAQHPLHVLGPVWVSLFLIFLSFSVFAVLNVVTGFFCQNAIATVCKSEEVLIYNDYQQHKDTVEKLVHVFRIMDEDHSGEISYDELETHLEDDCVRAVFDELQVGSDDARGLFQMLALDGVIHAEDFVTGLMRLRGAAKRIDVYGLSLQLKRLQQDIHGINKARVDKANQRNSPQVSPRRTDANN